MHIKREVKLAVTAIAALIILIWGINFLKAKALFDRNNVFYSVYSQVDGLKVSSNVIYRGYKVGQISAISFAGEHFDKVLVQFTVEKKLGIPVNSIAAIQSADLMGSKVINLVPGDSPQYAQSGDTLRSELELGLMEQFNKQIEPLKRKAENIMVSLDTVLVALQEIFSGQTNGNIRSSLKSVSRTLNNAEQASSTLNVLLSRESSRISEILGNVNNITANLENNNEKINQSLQNVALISDSLRNVNLAHTVRQLNGILYQVDSIMAKINQGQGTLGEVINNDALYYNLTTVSANLNNLLSEFRANPRRFINLSLLDFTSDKRQDKPYGIAIAQTDKALAPNAEIFIQHPDLMEIRKNDKFLYILQTYKNLKQAEKNLPIVNKSYKEAFIVKISQN